MSSELSINCNAFAKIILHCAKYPHFAVNGIILGPTKKSDKNEMLVLDVMPLFHGQLGLAPMLEVALTQIEEYLKNDGLSIVGYYQANENIRDNLPDFVAMRIAEKIAENNSDAYLIMVDNRKFDLESSGSPIIVSQLTSEGKWKNKDKSCVHLEVNSFEIASQLLERKVHTDICDFDNHLDDVTCDWSNKQITKLIQSLTSNL